MHFKILKIHFEKEISGKKSGKIFETGAGAGTGFSRISGRFLVWILKYIDLAQAHQMSQ